jgi:uncharacterized HAD superfamily protein
LPEDQQEVAETSSNPYLVGFLLVGLSDKTQGLVLSNNCQKRGVPAGRIHGRCEMLKQFMIFSFCDEEKSANIKTISTEIGLRICSMATTNDRHGARALRWK